jgi:hypothetical protein
MPRLGKYLGLAQRGFWRRSARISDPRDARTIQRISSRYMGGLTAARFDFARDVAIIRCAHKLGRHSKLAVGPNASRPNLYGGEHGAHA